ncbi:MAG: Sec-independent protein translocase protein TatB [Parvibaculum sp.]|uniref:Sec-independent protein translocase protein TatB n=1 Tax=Parvibaculum sp. TaxID=2024848 RepID=UPI002ABCA03E|nr:Sec-independent protein translocase protein TatB [Parvibaculum sp.]MDZ4381394.1 Sec-independent protein translocase protein TatB [Parvibaculum sp.]
MFDIGWSELLALVVIAIVFVGPKDLPRMMRTAGQYVAKVRAMAREFQTSFEDLARETELEELRKEVSSLRGHVTEPMRSLQREIDKPLKAGGGAGAETVKTSQPLDTSGVSDGIAGTIREAEAVEAYGASEPAPIGGTPETKRDGE